MAKKAIDYSKGKIYKVWSSHTDKIYIGSTTKEYLSQRLSNHKNMYVQWVKSEYKYITSFEIMKYDDYAIELIENYPCKSKDELLAREGFYIRLNKDICVNKMIPKRTDAEYREDNADIIKQKRKVYYEANKPEFAQRDKEYREKNAEIIKLKQKIKYEETFEKYAPMRKAYYEKTKEKYNEMKKVKVACDCGAVIRKDGISDHNKSKKHIQFIESH